MAQNLTSTPTTYDKINLARTLACTLVSFEQLEGLPLRRQAYRISTSVVPTYNIHRAHAVCMYDDLPLKATSLHSALRFAFCGNARVRISFWITRRQATASHEASSRCMTTCTSTYGVMCPHLSHKSTINRKPTLMYTALTAARLAMACRRGSHQEALDEVAAFRSLQRVHALCMYGALPRKQ